ncbi:MAG: hypothetical protein IJ658_12020 [Kiritimatiellae bacterium]|nr:hypothetical protein [Kiritimatiellia bacterium]
MKTALSFVVAALAALSVRAAAVGVEVDGIPLDSGGTSDAGWAYDPATSNLTLFGAGPFTLSGTNTAGEVRVCIPAGVTNRVTLAGLALEVESGRAAGVFRLEAGADVALTVAGTNSLCGGDGHAGLRVPPGASLALTNASADAVLTVQGGFLGAGLGGDERGGCGAVRIDGGTVVATGGAGSGTPDVGCDPASANAGRAATNLFTGGSIRLAQVLADPAPSNRVSRVWCVTMSGLAPNAPVTFAGLPAGYGTNGIVADEDGHVYLWLPNGDYAFSANGRAYGVAVQDGDALAEGTAADPSALWIGSFALSGRRATLGFGTDLGAAAFSRWIASGGASQLFVYFVETLDADTATDIAPDGIVDGEDGTATLTATLPAGATGFLQLVLYDDE